MTFFEHRRKMLFGILNPNAPLTQYTVTITSIGITGHVQINGIDALDGTSFVFTEGERIEITARVGSDIYSLTSIDVKRERDEGSVKHIATNGDVFSISLIVDDNLSIEVHTSRDGTG